MDLKNLEPEVYQVIHTLDTICDPNTVALAQAVFEIFCSQAPYVYTLACYYKKWKEEIIQSWI